MGLLATSCGRTVDYSVRVRAHPHHFSLTFRAEEIEGQCYAPDLFRFNGNLAFPNFAGVNRWGVTQEEPVKGEQLDRLLSARREKIGRRVELVVPRDAVGMRPSSLHFSIFACDAPTAASGWKGTTSEVLIVADLPPLHPPGYREPRAPSPLDNELMPYDNATPAPR